MAVLCMSVFQAESEACVQRNGSIFPGKAVRRFGQLNRNAGGSWMGIVLKIRGL